MEYVPILLIFMLFLCFGLLSKRLAGSMLTPPMLFVGVGLLFSDSFLNVFNFHIEHSLLHLLLEATLVLVLFSDAARINLVQLKKDHIIPQRMLLIGMPLCILVGGISAYFLPLGVTICEAALLAAMLSPTDAALGQAVVNSQFVPQRIRQSLNVESGLNDGIALPVILILASIASAITTENPINWFQFAALQLIFGPAAGVAVGYGGAKLLNHAQARGWVSEPGQGMISLVLAGLSFIIAEALGGNGFIAAFVAGLVLGNTIKQNCHYLFEFVETEGQLLTLSAFFFFGALLLPEALLTFNPWHWVFALLSLTVLRMLPVAIALAGMNLKIPTQLFLGWFGPRGLASILVVLLVLSEAELQNAETIAHVVFITVVLSVLLHGLSAAPFAKIYGRLAAAYPGCAENQPVSEMPTGASSQTGK